jgi:predicted transcriptional regulator
MATKRTTVIRYYLDEVEKIVESKGIATEDDVAKAFGISKAYARDVLWIACKELEKKGFIYKNRMCLKGVK